MTRIQA